MNRSAGLIQVCVRGQRSPAMPVALQKTCWEVHTSTHSGTQYSYDDLDLICCHSVVNGNGTPRERCVSMPECRRRQSGVRDCGEEDDAGDGGPGRGRKLSAVFVEAEYKRENAGMYGNSKETGHVPGAQSLTTVTDKDVDQSPWRPAGHSSGDSPMVAMCSDFPDEDHRSGVQALKDEGLLPDVPSSSSEPISPEVTKEEGKKCGCGEMGETWACTRSIVEDKANRVEPLPKEEVVIGVPGSPETKLSKMEDSGVDLTGSISGPTEEPFTVQTDAGSHPELCGEVMNSEYLDSFHVSKNFVAQCVSLDAKVPNSDVQSSCAACHSDNVDQVVAGSHLALGDLEAPLCLSGSGANSDEQQDGSSKLDSILEVPSAESEKEAPGHMTTKESDLPVSMTTAESDLPVSMTEPGVVRNGPGQVQTVQSSSGLLSEQRLLGNAQNNKLADLTPVCESLLDRASFQSAGCQVTPNVDRNDGVERDSKLQQSPIQLRARKSSREERDRESSRLDSMVLLIMKLNQLDQEIQDTLSSAPCQNGTPTLKRRIISEVDLVFVEGEGSVSDSSHSLSTHHRHQSSSQQSSMGLGGAKSVGLGGAKSKTVICTAFSQNESAETEAKEACSWLRAAGFPQYAQLYEDGEFPIEIPSVTRDHDFLDRDAIEALCRRLNTLNKCALLRLEITPQRKRSEDSDDDEPCAISGRWTFQRESKRWSRLDLDVFSPPPAPPTASDQDLRPPAGHLVRDGVGHSSESVLTDVSEQPEVDSLRGGGVSLGPAPGIGSTASVCSSGTSDGLPSPLTLGHFPFEARSASVDGGGAKSTRSRAKSFLKRMESLRLRSSSASSSRRRKKGPARPEISAPVPKDGLDEDTLRRFNCVDVGGPARPEGGGRPARYSTQTSSGSSQSEASSGSAVSTPSPVTRTRSHSTAAAAAKRAGMYLEGFDPFSLVLLQEGGGQESRRRGRRAEPSPTAENNQRNLRTEQEGRSQEGRVIYFYLPQDHKPGTFPKALADGGSGRRGDCGKYRAPRRVSSTSLDSRLSFYDNVPFPEMGDEEEEEESQDMEEEPAVGLQRLVSVWSSSGRGEEEEEEGDSDSALDSASPCPSSPLQKRLEEAENVSDQESTSSPAGEQDDSLTARERRDSGVGPSLTRTNRPQKLLWPSFQSSHRPSETSCQLQLGCQSVLQMNLLRKYSLLKITALLEKHTPTNKHGFSWAMPKFMKRMKVRDFRGRSVFGVPLQVNVQRSGQPLPHGIQQAMCYLHQQCLDQVGLFRKSGVKSRIQALRQMNESCGTDGGRVSYEGQSAYDVADMLKQYFRDLPEPLLTSKLSDTFLQIYQYMPKDQRLQAVRAAVLLLADENREVLQTLLCFLSDVTASAADNQMTCTNLAVCLAPSLFHLNSPRRDSSSPRVMSRKNALGKPDQRDLNENLAATQSLAHMIQECRTLFQIPEELSCYRRSYIDQSLSPCGMEELLEAHGPHGYRTLVQESLDALLKEAKDRFRGYDSCSTLQHAELACRKVHDGCSLRQWKVCVEVGAGPEDVLRRLVSEQASWDQDLMESRVLESLEPSVDIYQYVRSSMAPHPPTDYVVLRSWVTDLPKGVCALVCVSVEHEAAAVMGVRANTLISRYYIEPCGLNKSRVTHISRTDCRGRCPEWYSKLYGHLCVTDLVRIRDSFICPLDK